MARARVESQSKPSPGERDDAERLASFAKAIDELRTEIQGKLGEEDAEHVRRVRTVSSILGVSGRTLILLSLDPISFSTGVLALSAHKTLELMEIGHTALHGAYDRVPGAEAFRAADFRWNAPIDEESWRHAHNVRHHQYTNVQGHDPDLDFGGLRLSPRVPFRPIHRLQPVTNLLSWLGFATAINLHATGVLDVYWRGSGRRILQSGDFRTAVTAHLRFLRKAVPYYARELLLFPALSGPFFLKTLLGNLLSEVIRDVFAGATIYCGHVGATDYPNGSRATGRAGFYVMQVEAACDIEVSRIVSILCGGLDYQIEHHLYPRLPPNRLRQIAPRVREICEQHGIRYRSGRWSSRVKEVVGVVGTLRRNAEARPSRSTLGARSTLRGFVEA